MPTRPRTEDPPDYLFLQFLYFECLSSAKNLSDEEKIRLSRDLQYANADSHSWDIGLGGNRPQVNRILYIPKELAKKGCVLTVKRPGEELPDKPTGGARDLCGYIPLHDPKTLVLAINPDAREIDIMNAVSKRIKEIKKRNGKSRAAGGGRKHSIRRMMEALYLCDGHHRKNKPLPVYKLGMMAKTFRPISKDRKGLATEQFQFEDRGHKLLKLAKYMIETARKGPDAWVEAFPCID